MIITEGSPCEADVRCIARWYAVLDPTGPPPMIRVSTLSSGAAVAQTNDRIKCNVPPVEKALGAKEGKRRSLDC
jgi:hypothetical protein